MTDRMLKMFRRRPAPGAAEAPRPKASRMTTFETIVAFCYLPSAA